MVSIVYIYEDDRGKILIICIPFHLTASADTFKTHFATENKLITPVSLEAARDAKWATTKITRDALGPLTEARLDLPSAKKQETGTAPVVSLRIHLSFGCCC